MALPSSVQEESFRAAREFLEKLDGELDIAVNDIDGIGCNELNHFRKRIIIFLHEHSKQLVQITHQYAQCIRKYVECIDNHVEESLENGHLDIENLKMFTAVISNIPRVNEVRNRYLQQMVGLLETIIDPSSKPILTKELLINFNMILQGTKAELKHFLVDRNKQIFYQLMNILPAVCDYEHQLSIMETVFNMCSSKQINKLAHDLFPESIVLKTAFLNIRPLSFKNDVRIFLNLANKEFHEVTSLECERVSLDNIEVYALQGTSTRKIWINFNKISETLSITCDDGSLKYKRSNALLNGSVTVPSIHIKEENVKSALMTRVPTTNLTTDLKASIHLHLRKKHVPIRARDVKIIVHNLPSASRALLTLFGEKFKLLGVKSKPLRNEALIMDRDGEHEDLDSSDCTHVSFPIVDYIDLTIDKSTHDTECSNMVVDNNYFSLKEIPDTEYFTCETLSECHMEKDTHLLGELVTISQKPLKKTNVYEDQIILKNSVSRQTNNRKPGIQNKYDNYKKYQKRHIFKHIQTKRDLVICGARAANNQESTENPCEFLNGPESAALITVQELLQMDETGNGDEQCSRKEINSSKIKINNVSDKDRLKPYNKNVKEVNSLVPLENCINVTISGNFKTHSEFGKDGATETNQRQISDDPEPEASSTEKSINNNLLSTRIHFQPVYGEDSTLGNLSKILQKADQTYLADIVPKFSCNQNISSSYLTELNGNQDIAFHPDESSSAIAESKAIKQKSMALRKQDTISKHSSIGVENLIRKKPVVILKRLTYIENKLGTLETVPGKHLDAGKNLFKKTPVVILKRLAYLENKLRYLNIASEKHGGATKNLSKTPIVIKRQSHLENKIRGWQTVSENFKGTTKNLLTKKPVAILKEQLCTKNNVRGLQTVPEKVKKNQSLKGNKHAKLNMYCNDSKKPYSSKKGLTEKKLKKCLAVFNSQKNNSVKIGSDSQRKLYNPRTIWENASEDSFNFEVNGYKSFKDSSLSSVSSSLPDNSSVSHAVPALDIKNNNCDKPILNIQKILSGIYKEKTRPMEVKNLEDDLPAKKNSNTSSENNLSIKEVEFNSECDFHKIISPCSKGNHSELTLSKKILASSSESSNNEINNSEVVNTFNQWNDYNRKDGDSNNNSIDNAFEKILRPHSIRQNEEHELTTEITKQNFIFNKNINSLQVCNSDDESNAHNNESSSALTELEIEYKLQSNHSSQDAFDKILNEDKHHKRKNCKFRLAEETFTTKAQTHTLYNKGSFNSFMDSVFNQLKSTNNKSVLKHNSKKKLSHKNCTTVRVTEPKIIIHSNVLLKTNKLDPDQK